MKSHEKALARVKGDMVREVGTPKRKPFLARLQGKIEKGFKEPMK